MATEKLILFFVAIFYVLQNAYGFNQNRVVNGNATLDGVFEFLPRLKMISLEHGRTELSGGDCSATVILKRHILTAAHCVIIGERLNKNPDHERVSWVSALLNEYRPKPWTTSTLSILPKMQFNRNITFILHILLGTFSVMILQ